MVEPRHIQAAGSIKSGKCVMDIKLISFPVMYTTRRGCGSYNWMSRHGPLSCTIRDLTLLNSSSLANLLQLCIDSKSIWDGRRFHVCFIKSPFFSEIYVQNRLIVLYAKCGCLEDAQKLFRKMHARNTFSWNALLHAECRLGSLEDAAWLFMEMPDPDQCSWNLMISGFSQHGCLQGAVTFFIQMHSENFVLNMYAFSSARSACAGLMDLNLGMQIHAAILKSPLRPVSLWELHYLTCIRNALMCQVPKSL